jgi:peptide/nickel transport system permease protein
LIVVDKSLEAPGEIVGPKADVMLPPTVVVAIAVIGLLAAIATFADLIAPYGYRDQNLLARLKPPAFLGGSWDQVLGTDQLGRDVLSRVVYAIRFSIAVAIGGTSIGALLGTFLGFLAAHFRGHLEEFIMLLADVQTSLPFMLIALTLTAVFGGNLLVFVAVMGLYGWETFARLTRGVVISARNQGYATAIVALGAPPRYVYMRHILINILSVLVVQFTLNFPQVILLESSLSFLGLGIRPPLTSLGQMLGEGRAYLTTAWWIAVIPGSIIFLATLSISLIGDWLRDRLDPALSGA